jgi:signal transduction histidine kinase
MYHHLLQKQVNRYLANMPMSDELNQLLDAVNASYLNFERDKELSEHAFSISETEYADINQKLTSEINQRKRSEIKLVETIHSLSNGAELQPLTQQNIEEIVDYLKIQVEKRKEAEIAMLQAKELAEKAAMARSEFLSMMSHEIRTPLNAVVGFTYLLLEDEYLPDQVEKLNLLKFSADNLLALINNILDFNKIESGKVILEKTSFSLLKLINQVKNTNSAKAQDNGNNIRIMFDTQIPAVVIGDSLRLGQVISNLVSNAVKFTNNGIVIIEAILLQQTAQSISVQFSVKDTGIGIAPENQQRIFEIFTQASESTTRQYGGSDLGLAICSRLLEMMNSRIVLESAPGKGAAFSFVLELPYTNATEENAGELTSGLAGNELAGMKILLVEDNHVNTLVATTFLERWEIKVDVAENGKEAVEKIKTNEYHAVLMDLHMPEMNGYEACEHIMLLKPSLPVIALTASAMLNIKDKVFEVGMVDYVTKPFEPNELFEKIRKNSLPIKSPV